MEIYNFANNNWIPPALRFNINGIFRGPPHNNINFWNIIYTNVCLSDWVNSTLSFKTTQNWRSKRASFSMKGVRPVKIFFLINFGWIRGTKFFTSPKLWGTFPVLYDSISASQNRKMVHLWFLRNYIEHFRSFLRDRRRTPRNQQLLPANIR